MRAGFSARSSAASVDKGDICVSNLKLANIFRARMMREGELASSAPASSSLASSSEPDAPREVMDQALDAPIARALDVHCLKTHDALRARAHAQPRIRVGVGVVVRAGAVEQLYPRALLRRRARDRPGSVGHPPSSFALSSSSPSPDAEIVHGSALALVVVEHDCGEHVPGARTLSTNEVSSKRTTHCWSALCCKTRP
jgi:hypothetical protein